MELNPFESHFNAVSSIHDFSQNSFPGAMGSVSGTAFLEWVLHYCL